MSAEAIAPPPRRRRLGLYLPITLLVLLGLGWTGAWFYIREQVKSGLDQWISQEATAGRRWSCADRAIQGYPVRIEIRCAEFTIDRPDVHVSIGKLQVVTQVYKPRHIIAEASGPLRITASQTQVDGRWKLLQASVMTKPGGFDLVSIVADEPFVSVQEPGVTPFDLSSKRFEGHLRPQPADPTAMDLAMKSDAAVIPILNELLGGNEASDISINLSVTQTDDLPARPLWSELERWRAADGKVQLTSLKLAKGRQRLEGTGLIGIDAMHRPEGQLELSGAGLGGLLGQVLNSGGSLLGALLGGGRQPEQAAPGSPLRRLPPVRLQNGRVQIGPVTIPGLRIPALY